MSDSGKYFDQNRCEFHQVIPFEEIASSILALKKNADVDFLKRAYDYSEEAHKGQTRDEGSPYFVHPCRTALFLIKRMNVGDEEIIASALLHDALEDNRTVTFDELKQRFGEKVAAAVLLLSKPAVNRDMTRPEQLRVYHNTLSKAPREVLLIKFADRLDNLRSLYHTHFEKKKKRYLMESVNFYLPLAKRHYPEIAEQIDELIKNIQKEISQEE